MKTKKFKRVLTLVLALAMMLSLSMVAFATGDGEVTVIVRESNYNLTTHQFSYSPIDTINAEYYTGDTVYDVLNNNYSPAVWHTSGNVHYLEGIMVNNNFYEDVRVEAAASCYNEDDEYEGGNAVIDSLNLLPEFVACDGVYMSMAMLMDDESLEGYYIMGDMQHMCSITYDWIYEVDYANDGYGNFVYPPDITNLSDTRQMYTMDECVLSDGDIVRLTYGLVWTIFE